MIPKILHWGLFAGHKLSPLNRRCMATWKKVLPDYEVRAWDDRNGPKRRWFQDALRECPINAHNYMELWTLWTFGGVMVDNDVEMVRPFDLGHGMFIGRQKGTEPTDAINCAVLGATPRHPMIEECLFMLEKQPVTHDPVWCGCGLMTRLLRRIGMKDVDQDQRIGGIMIYARDRFYPYFHDEPPLHPPYPKRTIAIHRWEGSWKQNPYDSSHRPSNLAG